MAKTTKAVTSQSSKKKTSKRVKPTEVKAAKDSASQIRLSDLLAAAKQYWKEGSLFEESVGTKRLEQTEQANANPVLHQVSRILRQTSQSFSPLSMKEILLIDQWSDELEFEEREEERPHGHDTYAEIAVYDVLTADADIVRVAIYQDGVKSSIDRLSAGDRLPAACRVWRDRWGKDSIPAWVCGIADC